MNLRPHITDPLYTIRGAADYLRVSVRYAYYLVARGELPTVNVGGRRKVFRSTLDALLDRHCTYGQ